MLQNVASLTDNSRGIIELTILEASFTLIYDVYSAGFTYDSHHNINIMCL